MLMAVSMRFTDVSSPPCLLTDPSGGSMTFNEYLRQLCKFVLSSSVVLGTIIGVANLIVEESTANANLEFDIGGPGGLWLIPGLPLVALLIFAILSPLSFQVYKRLSRKRAAADT